MKSTILVFLISVCCALSAQNVEEWEAAEGFLEVETHSHSYDTAFAGGSTSEIQYLFSGLFLLYKAFISSQDGQSCSFTPSCSAYGLDAVRLHGPLKGALMGFDRLTRCHGLSPEWYEYDRQMKLLIDPVQ